jgi:hypothetical protein
MSDKLQKLLYFTISIILVIYFFRLTTPFRNIPDIVFIYIYCSISLIFLLPAIFLYPAVIRFFVLPLAGAFAVFLSSAIHAFEGNRMAVLITFVSQLYMILVFHFLNMQSVRKILILVKVAGWFFGLSAIIMLVFGVDRILDLTTYLGSGATLRNLRGFFSNNAYLGYISMLMLALVVLKNRIQGWDYLTLSVFLFTLLFSSNRESLMGFFLILSLQILTRSYKAMIFRISYIVVFGIFITSALVLWYLSPLNFKTPDSSRLILYYSALNYIVENPWFGTGQSMLMYGNMTLDQTHNFYLATWARYGLFTLLAYLAYYLYFFLISKRRGRIIMAFLFFSFFLSPLYGVRFSATFLLVMILIVYFNHNDKNMQAQRE